MSDAARLDRTIVLRAFRLMAEHLSRSSQRGEILVASGTAIAFAYDTSRVTRDVDGLALDGHGPVMDAARIASSELGLDRGWLNEGVSVYLSTQPDPERTTVFDHPHLAVMRVSTRHLFALKARAARAQDLDDLRLLADDLAIDSAAAAFALVQSFFPDDPISGRAASVIEDFFDSDL